MATIPRKTHFLRWFQAESLEHSCFRQSVKQLKAKHHCSEVSLFIRPVGRFKLTEGTAGRGSLIRVRPVLDPASWRGH